MLQRIRDNASGPLAYAVVGLISLVFGVWGIGSYFTPSANPVVASVGDVKITRYQLQQSYNQQYRDLRERMGSDFDSKSFKPEQLRKSVLQQLIRSAVLDQYAVNNGYRTTDNALLQVLTSNPQFQVNGKFSEQRYKALLSNAGLQPAAYEQRLRRSILSNQVRAGVITTAFAAPPAVTHAYGVLMQQRKADYLLFSGAQYKDQVKLSADDVSDWYHQHEDLYQRPARVQLAYVELSRDTLGDNHKVDKDTLQKLYDENKSRFSTPDHRDGWQLFVPVTKDSADQARKTVQRISRELDQGKSFSDIAADIGDDVQASKLDDVTREQLPDDVANALFGVDVGQASKPVRGDKGWYVVKATKATPGRQTPFSDADVQKQLKKMALSRWQNKQFSKLAERMETLAFQAPNSLDTLSSELDLKVQHSDWITRDKGENKLGQSDAVRQAAFSDNVLDKGLNSTVIQLDKNHRVVIRVAKHEKAQTRPLDEVKDKVRAHLTTVKAQQLAQQAAQSAQKELAKGGDDVTLKSIASETNAQLKSPGYVSRNSNNVPAAIRQRIFALHAPEDDKPAYGVVRTRDGNAALVALSKVKTNGTAKGDNVPKAFSNRERSYVASLEYRAFADYLNAHADVDIDKKELERQ